MEYKISLGHKTQDNTVKNVTTIPQIGLGVFDIHGKACVDTCVSALEIGYRLFDTASAYNNEKELGHSIKISKINRGDLFITTKIKRQHATGFNDVIDRCKKSLECLKLDFLDLYLIHAPPRDSKHRVESWLGMQECLEKGLTKAIGVSNYGAHHLDMMFNYADILPSVNQIEIHPWLQRIALTAATKAIGAKVMAYSPIARGRKNNDAKILKISERIGCTPSQLLIKWGIDCGFITIPKSQNRKHLVENFNSLNFDTTPEKENIVKLNEYFISSGWDPSSET